MVGLEKFLGFGPGQVNNGWTGKVSWFWSRAGEQWLDWKSILGLGPGQVDNVSDF